MNIRVDLNTPIKDGTEVVFRSPVDCSQVTGLKVYYIGADGNTASQEFAFADAHGNNVGNIDHLFAENVAVKVILDVTTGMAFVQNADTNAYLESKFSMCSNTLTATKEGRVIKIDDVSPLQTEVTLEFATAQMMPSSYSTLVYGKNLINYKDCRASTCEIYSGLLVDGVGFRITKTASTGQTAKMPIYVPANTPFVVSYRVKEFPEDRPYLWCYVWLKDGTRTTAKTHHLGDVLQFDQDVVAIRFGINANAEAGATYAVVDLQVEVGETSTEYVPYVEPNEFHTSDKVHRYQTLVLPYNHETGLTVFIRNSEWLGRIKYNRDIVKAFEELQNAIISLGGNV